MHMGVNETGEGMSPAQIHDLGILAFIRPLVPDGLDAPALHQHVTEALILRHAGVEQGIFIKNRLHITQKAGCPQP